MLQIKLSRRNSIGEPVGYGDTTHLFAIIILCYTNDDGEYITDVELRSILIGKCNAINEWNFQRFAAKFYADVVASVEPFAVFTDGWQPPEIFGQSD